MLQHVGQGTETITLPGVIYPEFRGGTGQLDAMREIAGKGEPLSLIDGGGGVMGLFAIERIEEKQAVFAAAGVPRKVEFTLQLRRFFPTEEGDLASGGFSLGGLSSLVSNFTGTSAAIPADAVGEVAQTKGLADSLAAGAKDVGASLSSYYTATQTALAPYGAVARNVTGATARCLDCANQLQATGVQVSSIVSKNPVSAVAFSGAQTMNSRATGLLGPAQSASAILRRSVGQLEAIGNVPTATMQLVRGAASSADRTAALARQTASESSKIMGLQTA